MGLFRMDQRWKNSFLATVWLPAFLFAANLPAADHYVAPRKTPGGNGSFAKPWDLQTALKHPRRVQPGDTIWLRGGVHRQNDRPTKFQSTLQGRPGQPVTVRTYHRERAIIDGNIAQTAGGWANYHGLEIMNSHPHRVTEEKGSFPKAFWMPDPSGKTTDFAASGFDVRAPHVKLINLIIHDSIGGGIFISTDAANSEIYGTLCFYNGWQGGDRGHGHGVYAQNVDPSIARVEENIFFENYALGFHATGTGPVVDNFQLKGNVCFFNSVLSRRHQGNLLIGPHEGAATGITLIQNFIYETEPSGSDCNIGYLSGITHGRLEQNYFATKVSFSRENLDVRRLNNIILSGSPPSPAANVVEIRRNKYEPERAHIIVYNWLHREAIPVDIKGIIAPGTNYELRNAQDVLGPPVGKGIYQGGMLSLPMRTNLLVANPQAAELPPSTAPEFNVFILQASPADHLNTPPSLSEIENQNTRRNTTTSPIHLRVADAETPPEFLNISANSSNPAVVPHRNIHFGGSDSAPILTITPAPEKVGTSVITLAVSDGFRSTIRSFVLNVADAP